MGQPSLSRRALFLYAGAALAPARQLASGACFSLPTHNWASLGPARQLVRSGALGPIVFCRAFQDQGCDSLAALQFLMDAPPAISVTEHGAASATIRYPGFIASFETARRRQDCGIVICGSHATLAVKRDGWRRLGHEA